jgi:hypothetical protein
VLGIAWFWLGDLVSARGHLEQASHTPVAAAAGRSQALGAAPPLASRPPRRRRRDCYGTLVRDRLTLSSARIGIEPAMPRAYNWWCGGVHDDVSCVAQCIAVCSRSMVMAMGTRRPRGGSVCTGDGLCNRAEIRRTSARFYVLQSMIN